MGQDALTLQKAEVFAKIAAAVAATGFVTEDVFVTNETAAVTGKESLERKPGPKKVVVGTTKPEDMPKPVSQFVPEPAPAWLTSEEFNMLKELGSEPADKKAERIKYLLKNYGSKQMKELAPEIFPYFHLEGGELESMKCFLEEWNADVDRWKIKAATEISRNRTTAIGELTVEEYLTKLIPAVGHLNYLLSFGPDQYDDLLQAMNRVSKDIKKLDDLRFINIDFVRKGVDSVIDGTFDEIEKVS